MGKRYLDLSLRHERRIRGQALGSSFGRVKSPAKKIFVAAIVAFLFFGWAAPKAARAMVPRDVPVSTRPSEDQAERRSGVAERRSGVGSKYMSFRHCPSRSPSFMPAGFHATVSVRSSDWPARRCRNGEGWGGDCWDGGRKRPPKWRLGACSDGRPRIV